MSHRTYQHQALMTRRCKKCLLLVFTLVCRPLHSSECALHDTSCEYDVPVMLLQFQTAMKANSTRRASQRKFDTAKAPIPSLSGLGDVVESSRTDQMEKQSALDGVSYPQSSLELLFGGYNIFYGYPITDAETDPGFSKYSGKPVFFANYTHSDKVMFQERRRILPDGFAAVSAGSSTCSLLGNVTSLYRSRELVELLNSFVRPDMAEASPGWFRASHAFTTFERMKQNRIRNVVGTSLCGVVELQISQSKRPPLSLGFLQRVRALPSEYDARAYFDFFDDYGTHVITSATLGAMMGNLAYFNESSYIRLNSSNIPWTDLLQTNALSLGFQSQPVSNNSLSALQRGSLSFSLATQEGRIARGPAPRENDASSWAESVARAPVPFRLKLISICSIFRDISAQKQIDCELAAKGSEYCMRRVMPREGMDPRMCLQDASDIDCLWNADCGLGSLCKNTACVVAGVEVDSVQSRLDDDTRTSTADHAFHIEISSALNSLVVVPMLVVATPLAWAWWQLLSLSDSDEVWTAQDENLREVDISSIGASGVVLLRTPSDRKLAILLSFAGIMLQTMFLYYMSIYSFLNAGGEQVTHDAPPMLLFGSIFMNTVSCCGSVITGMKAWDTTAPKGYETLHYILVGLDSFVIPFASVIVGSIFLCTSSSIASLVLSSTAMAFVCSINNRLAELMSWSLSAHGGRIFQPAKLGIKDAVNSMQYTYMSLAFAAVVAMIMVPVGTFLFKV